MTRHYNRVSKMWGQRAEAKVKLILKNELIGDGHAGTISMCKGPVAGK